MALGTLFGLIAVAAAIGLLSLAGWFLTATALAGLAPASAVAFNFFFPSIGVRLFAFIRTGVRYAERLVTHDTTFRILAGLRVWFYRHLEPLAPAGLAHYHSGDVLNRLVEDIDTLDNLYLRVLSPTVVALTIATILLVFLGWFDIGMATWGILFLLIAGFVVPATSAARGAAAGREMGRDSARLRTLIIEGFQGLGELLVFGAHQRHMENIRRTNTAMMSHQKTMSHVSALSEAATILLTGAAVTTILYIGIARVSNGSLTGASLALVTLAVLAAFEAVHPLPRAYQYLGRIQESCRRLKEVVETEPAIRFPDQSKVMPPGFDITFEDVSFRYPDHTQKALEAIQLYIPAGHRLAILGETGSGKSTLLNLLVRFWDPSEGRILMGGKDMCSLSETDLRRYVNAVSQRSHLFGATIRENLLLANPDATEAQLRMALELACLLSFVDALPEGMDTWVGESGRLLSGGQARRLAMARCFLKDGPIWILDEPTEGLDQSTGKKLLSNIFEKTKGKTLLLITHRMVDLHQMDLIVILKGGRIISQGSPEVLLTSEAVSTPIGGGMRKSP